MGLGTLSRLGLRIAAVVACAFALAPPIAFAEVHSPGGVGEAKALVLPPALGQVALTAGVVDMKPVAVKLTAPLLATFVAGVQRGDSAGFVEQLTSSAAGILVSKAYDPSDVITGEHTATVSIPNGDGITQALLSVGSSNRLITKGGAQAVPLSVVGAGTHVTTGSSVAADKTTVIQVQGVGLKLVV